MTRKPIIPGVIMANEPATLENHHHHILYLIGMVKRLQNRLDALEGSTKIYDSTGGD